MATRKILVVGATGRQGGAVVKALLANPPPFDYKILALTRSTSSPAAQALASRPNVELIQGSLTNPSAIFEAAGGQGSIWGVFCVTIPSFKTNVPINEETKSGNDLVDAAVENKVKHFIYTSVDRHGDESESNPTEVLHFKAKHDTEMHLKDKAKGTDMTWTIIRPVAFMENMAPSLFGRMFGAMWNNMGETKLQLVATKDVGIVAAQAFANADSEKFKNKSYSLAGDELNQMEADAIFQRVFGRPMLRTYGFMGRFLQYMIPEVGKMFTWFVDVGYGADIKMCKQMNPEMMDLETWLKTESGHKR